MDANANANAVQEAQPEGSVPAQEPEVVAKTESVEKPAEIELSPEAQLAADALEATGTVVETPATKALKSEDERLLGSITAKRQLNRELDATIAKKLAAEEAAKPPEPSPLEKFVEEFPDDPVPGKVTLAEAKFQQKQAAQAEKKRAETRTGSDNNKFKSAARSKFSDYDAIIESARDLVTEGDAVDIRNAANNGENPAEKLYEICILRTLTAGGDRARTLRAKLQAKLKTKAKASVQKTNNTDGSTEKENEIPGQAPESFEQANNDPNLANIYALFG